MAKTLIQELSNSPYFSRMNSGLFSKIVFKPGYPLQSAELIELQDILQTQIKRFGNHIFKDGSIVSGGSVRMATCYLYPMEDVVVPNIAISDQQEIAFTNIETGVQLETANFIGFKESFVSDGVKYPTMIAVDKDISSVLGDIGINIGFTVSQNYFDLGNLADNTAIQGKSITIEDSIFYVSGFFTNMSKQTFIFAFDGYVDMSNFNMEVGVELEWEFIDVEDNTYGTLLLDPATNSFNENAPGADRLKTTLHFTSHEYGYNQTDEDWMFIPLVKFKNAEIVFERLYPMYANIGDSIARRTKEINGNFVVDPFPFELLDAAPYIEKFTVLTNEDNGTSNTVTLTVDSETVLQELKDDFDMLQTDDVDLYLMFGDDVDYNRLLRVSEVAVEDSYIRTDDLFYDRFIETDQTMLDQLSVLQIRNEHRLRCKIGTGIAYLNGYRFETTFETKIDEQKARNVDQETNRAITQNTNGFRCSEINFTDGRIEFDKVSEVDLHSVPHAINYNLICSPQLSLNAGDSLTITGATFECVSGNIFNLSRPTKATLTGVPVQGVQFVYNGTNHNLTTIEEAYTSPFQSDVVYNSAEHSMVVDSISNNVYTIKKTTGTFSNIEDGDIIEVRSSNDVYVGEARVISPSGTSIMDIGFVSPSDFSLNVNTVFKIKKVSSDEKFLRQYNSTKVGSVKVYGMDTDTIFYIDTMVSEPISFRVFSTTGMNCSAATLDLSMVDGAYDGMTLTYFNGQYRKNWKITGYVGSTQTFTLEGDAVEFSEGDTLSLFPSVDNAKSIVNATSNGVTFFANLLLDDNNFAIRESSNNTRKRFVDISSNGNQVKTITDTTIGSVFVSYDAVVGASNMVNINVNQFYSSNNDIDSSKIVVYAKNKIEDTSDIGTLLFHNGEQIPVSNANSSISNGILSFKLDGSTISSGTNILVYVHLPVSNAIPKEKVLTLYEDSFSLSVVDGEIVTSSRYDGSFILNHADVYRIRKIEMAASSSLIDVTNFFDFDDGQRDGFYDHSRFTLKRGMTFPIALAGKSSMDVVVTYDYFQQGAGDGYFFSVDSYVNVHYRNIPTYQDQLGRKFPLRNVIDFRPVKKPMNASSGLDFENEFFLSSNMIVDFDFYQPEEKFVMLSSQNGSDVDFEIVGNVSDANDSVIKLYRIVLNAYTFTMNDVITRMIDNRNFTMKDIANIQKRVEIIEDVVQLNALEIQALKTVLLDGDGNRRFTNAMLVDMFAGFSVANVEQSGFAASIDMVKTKLYPKFTSQPVTFKTENFVPDSSIERYGNVFMKKILGHETIINSIDTSTTETTIQISTPTKVLKLFPFSDVWFSQTKTPNVLKNEDSQFKNWEDSGFGTQWGDWEQFWSGVVDDTEQINTSSLKVGQINNAKNSITTNIDGKLVNKIISFFNREVRIGFVEHGITGTISVEVNGDTTAFNYGTRLKFTDFTSPNLQTLKRNYLHQTLTQSSTSGVVQEIVVDGADVFFYVSNVTGAFTTGTLDRMTQSVSEFSILSGVDSNGVVCGDFMLNEGAYNTQNKLVVELLSDGVSVSSSEFYFGGILPTVTEFTKSSRPVQRKFATQTIARYITDRTSSIDSNSIYSPTFQTFQLDASRFITSTKLKFTGAGIVTVAIQPVINGEISPSLVLPFSQKTMSVAAGENEFVFDAPVFIQGNQPYALSVISSSNIKVYTTNSTANGLYEAKSANETGITVALDEKLQVEFKAANFSTEDAVLKIVPNNLTEKTLADHFRVNFNGMALTGTSVNFEYKTKNQGSSTFDSAYTQIEKNLTSLCSAVKEFDNLNFFMNVTLGTNDSTISPVIDLERLYMTSILHNTNDGYLTTDHITVDTSYEDEIVQGDNLLITVTDSDGNILKFYTDSNGTIQSFVENPARFGLNSTDFTSVVEKVQEDGNVTLNGVTISISTEFEADSIKNSLEYRYFSQVVDMEDDFAATAMYVQLDGVLHPENEVYVYCRTCGNDEEIATKDFVVMECLTIAKYSSDGITAKSIEFEANSTTPFNKFQVKLAFATSNPIKIPIFENVRILALDN